MKALLSVSDKRGLLDFARGLDAAGIGLIASGGTARALRDGGLPVQSVEDLTGLPSVLGGRVKTLHPAIHGGILAQDTPEDRATLDERGWHAIDLVVVNLYPFVETVAKPGVTEAEAIEQIDIGGVALIRAAAKNYARVTVITSPEDYAPVLEEIQANGQSTPETRRRLAHKAFAATAAYDAAIDAYFLNTQPEPGPPPTLAISLPQAQALRYGENPHQQAALYAPPGSGPLGGTLLQGKALSYNNLLDVDAAWTAAEDFDSPTIVIVKHLSPCGIASGYNLPDVFRAALASDPVSAFGSVIACNRPFDGATAEALGKLFVECIAAPDYTPDALETLKKRKNCRVLKMGATAPGYQLRAVRGGVLAQTPDVDSPEDWRVVSQRQPTQAELTALQFAWQAVKHVKSNAIVIAGQDATFGIGGGLPSRVDAAKLAAEKAGERATGAVLASDAFFPFADGVEVAAAAGVTAVVEPGGSVRDDEVIAAADRLGLALCFTGVRHFRH
jgi:phosphoribosylaminoimidazolecarboxamide formyltransferase/IMP cyclohydrolase